MYRVYWDACWDFSDRACRDKMAIVSVHPSMEIVLHGASDAGSRHTQDVTTMLG